jgi:hypothetical protein
MFRVHDLKTYQPPNSHIANGFNESKRIQENGLIHHLQALKILCQILYPTN